MFLKMLGIALLVAFVSAVLYLVEKNTAFGQKKYPIRQLVYGAAFGMLAILSTEVFGVPVGGAVANVRDAAPICAGLLFGGPAGVIAGVIGGVERWFSVYWGGGTFTRLACSVSTVVAGVLAAALRKYMLDNKKPTWSYGLATGLVVEVLHLLSIFVFRMDDVQTGFHIFSVIALPMIAFNGLAVMLSVLAVSLLSGEKPLRRLRQKQITQTVQSWLLLCVTTAFLVTCVFIYVLQTSLADSDAKSLLRLSIEDVKETIREFSDNNMLALTRTVAAQMNDSTDSAWLQRYAREYHIAEINIVDKNGRITVSTNPQFVGFDMASGEQSAEFLVLLKGVEEYVQGYQPITYDISMSRKYAGVALPNGGFIQIGYDAEQFQQDIDATVVGITHNWHVGKTGSMIVSDKSGLIVSDDMGYEGQTLSAVGISLVNRKAGETFLSDAYGSKSVCMTDNAEGYDIIALMTREEVFYMRNVSVYITAFMEVILFAAIFVLIYMLIKLLVVDNIRKVNSTLSKITEGKLDETVDVRSSEEFVSLSDDINTTVDTLKRYITEAEERLDAELAFAKNIQASMLPCADGAFYGREEFSIYASMTPAKEVGGDFYDFFLVDDNLLALVIADVSGKGVPAALFMVRAMTMIRNAAQAGFSPKVVLETVNNQLCEGNDAEMFVTVWLGVLELSTGKLIAANAGHEYPAVMRSGGDFALFKDKHGFVLAGMEGTRYKEYELTLNKGDKLYVYTDGVAEATDASNRLFGTERMILALNRQKDASCKDLILGMKSDIDGFVGAAPQFDDITMLCVEMKKQSIKEITVTPDGTAMEEVSAFVESTLQTLGVPAKVIVRMNIAVDEIFSNIVSYSNATIATIRCGLMGESVILRFCDDGMPYDPTQKENPDTTLSADEREIGGLGIYMVKKSMDSVEYMYQNGQNVLTIKKKLSYQ